MSSAAASVPSPQERSWIERIADWKRRQRRDDPQLLPRPGQPRLPRRRGAPSQRPSRKSPSASSLNQTTFAQVPLLNPDQLVTAWREMLPDYRDTRVSARAARRQAAAGHLSRRGRLRPAPRLHHRRRLGPRPRHQAVARPAAGVRRGPLHAASRSRAATCSVLASQQPVGNGQTGADGVLTIGARRRQARRHRRHRRAAATRWRSAIAGQLVRQRAAARSWSATSTPTSRSIGPGTRVHVKAVLRWREQRCAAAVRSAERGDQRHRRQRQGRVPPAARRSTSSARSTRRSRCRRTAALGYYSVRVASRRPAGDRRVRGRRNIGGPSSRSSSRPRRASSSRAAKRSRRVQARYYFGQPVANAKRPLRRQPAGATTRRCAGTTARRAKEGGYFYGGDQRVEGELRLDAQGRGEIRVPLERRRERPRLQRAHRSAGHRCQQPRGQRQHHRPCDATGRSCISAQTSGYIFRRSAARAGDAARARLHGQSAGRHRRHGHARAHHLSGGPLLGPDGHRDRRAHRRRPRPTARRRRRSRCRRKPGSYRVRVTAPYEDREIRAETWIWVPGAAEGQERRAMAIGISSCSPTSGRYAPGDTARVIIRGEPVSGPVLVTKEGQHVTWHRRARGRTPATARGADRRRRRRRHLRQRRRSCATAGSIAPSGACRCRPPIARCRSR